MQLASKMITATSKAYVTRDSILKLLSDDEVARVSTAETAVNLAPRVKPTPAARWGTFCRAKRFAKPLGPRLWRSWMRPIGSGSEVSLILRKTAR
jgi:hypothetical protein